MRTLSSLLVVVCLATVVRAQPAPPPQQPYPPPQQPYPPPQQPYPPPAYGYSQPPMQAQLTLDEQYLLERGYISDGQHIGGGLVAIFFGMGIGQAIQGRWTEKGWIFTIGDIGTGAVFMYGFMNLFVGCFEGCSGQEEEHAAQLMLVGLIGHLVFRTWETIDAFVEPPAHNRKLRALHMRLGMPVPMYTRVTPYVAPSKDGDGAIAGLSLRF